MAEDVIAPGRAGVVLDLLLLRRVSPWLRVLLALAVLAASAALAQLALDAHHHFAPMSTTDRLGAVLGRGSSAATAWTGWVAALFFAVAVRRLRRGAPEPPAGRVPVESLSLAQIRRALRREYTVARVALLVVALVAAFDLARAARYAVAALSGDRLARATLLATVVEAVGLLVAAAVLMLWALSFRAQLERLGALR